MKCSQPPQNASLRQSPKSMLVGNSGSFEHDTQALETAFSVGAFIPLLFAKWMEYSEEAINKREWRTTESSSFGFLSWDCSLCQLGDSSDKKTFQILPNPFLTCLLKRNDVPLQKLGNIFGIHFLHVFVRWTFHFIFVFLLYSPMQ